MEIGVLAEKLVTFSFLNLRISIHRTKMSYRNYHPLHRLMCLRGGRKEGRKEGGGGGKEGRKEGKKKGRKEKRKEGKMKGRKEKRKEGRKDGEYQILCHINTLHHDISTHIHHTVFFTCPKVLTKMICLTIKSLFGW